ncbi:hypothetical protein ACVMYR_26805 [Micromonospora sp. PTRAS2]
MDQQTLATWAAAAVATVSALIVLGQLRVQRRQGQLQEAEAHRQQAKAWAELADSWDLALLATIGTAAVGRFGVTQAKAAEFLDAVERYRETSVAYRDISLGEVAGDFDKAHAEQMSAAEGLAAYRSAARRIITHLAQVSSLVLRGRLSLHAAYEAFGLDVIRAEGDLSNLLRSSFGHGSNCPASENWEWDTWRELGPEQVARRIGWGEFLDVARGTAERIDLFLALLLAHGVRVGDLDAGFQDFGNPPPGHGLNDRKRLATAWRSARRHGLARAVRLTWRLAAAGRQVRGNQRWRKIESAPGSKRLRPWRRLLRRQPEAILVGRDVIDAYRLSRSVDDLRRMNQPPFVQGDEDEPQ